MEEGIGDGHANAAEKGAVEVDIGLEAVAEVGKRRSLTLGRLE